MPLSTTHHDALLHRDPATATRRTPCRRWQLQARARTWIQPVPDPQSHSFDRHKAAQCISPYHRSTPKKKWPGLSHSPELQLTKPKRLCCLYTRPGVRPCRSIGPRGTVKTCLHLIPHLSLQTGSMSHNINSVPVTQAPERSMHRVTWKWKVPVTSPRPASTRRCRSLRYRDRALDRRPAGAASRDAASATHRALDFAILSRLSHLQCTAACS